MVLQQWPDLGGSTFCIDQDLIQSYLRQIRSLPNKEKRFLRYAAKFFAELAGIVSVDDLKRGWEKKVFDAGRILTKKGKELFTLKQLKEALECDGQIRFFPYKPLTALKIINSLRKKN